MDEREVDAPEIGIHAGRMRRGLTKDEAKEQLRFGGMMFAGFLASAFLIGWLMYPFPL